MGHALLSKVEPRLKKMRHQRWGMYCNLSKQPSHPIDSNPQENWAQSVDRSNVLLTLYLCIQQDLSLLLTFLPDLKVLWFLLRPSVPGFNLFDVWEFLMIDGREFQRFTSFCQTFFNNSSKWLSFTLTLWRSFWTFQSEVIASSRLSILLKS